MNYLTFFSAIFLLSILPFQGTLFGADDGAPSIQIQVSEGAQGTVVDQEQGFSALTMTIEHQDGSALNVEETSVAWRRRFDGNEAFWNGQSWQSAITWLPIGGAGPALQVTENGTYSAALDDRGSTFWDGADTVYDIKVRETTDTTTVESTWRAVSFEYAALSPASGLTATPQTNGDFRVNWDPPQGVPADTFTYALGVQNSRDGSWLDADWLDQRISGETTLIDGDRLDPATAYQLVLYRFRNNATNPVGSDFPATLEILSSRPVLLPPVDISSFRLVPAVPYSNITVAERSDTSRPFQVTTTAEVPDNLSLLGHIRPINGTRHSFYGIRDRLGHWLTPDWRRLPSGVSIPVRYLMRDNKLRPNETYEIVMTMGDRHQRTEEVVIAEIRYEPANLLAAKSSLSSATSSFDSPHLGPSVQKTTNGTPLYSDPSPWHGPQYYLYVFRFDNWPENLLMNDVRVSFISDGRIFDGEKWVTLDQSSNAPYGFRLGDVLDRSFFSLTYSSIQGENRTRYFGFRWGNEGSNSPLSFVQGLGDQLVCGTQVEGRRQEVTLDIRHFMPFSADSTQHMVNTRDPITMNLSIDASFLETTRHVSTEEIHWLWRDEDTGEMWDGYQWLAPGDQPPWSLVYRVGQGAPAAAWPGLALTNSANSMAVSYLPGPYRDAFFDGTQRRRLRIFFRDQDMGADVVNDLSPFTKVLHFDQVNANVHLTMAANNWGLSAAGAFAGGIVLDDHHKIPEPAGLSTQLERQPGNQIPNGWHLVLRLYEPGSGGRFQPLFSSEPMPLNGLAGDQGATRLAQAFQSLLTEAATLPGYPYTQEIYPTALVPRGPDMPYRLGAFLVTDRNNGSATEFYQPELPLPGMQVSLRVAGFEVAALVGERNEDILANTVPVHYRTLSDHLPAAFLLQSAAVGNLKSVPRPLTLQGRAAANHGDRLSLRLSDLGLWAEAATFEEAYPQGTFSIYELPDGAAEPVLLETRPQENGLVFDQRFRAGVSYRIVYQGFDRFGLPARVSQDFGSVRSLDQARVALAFGGADSNVFEHPVLETSLTADLNLNYSLDYPGYIATANHRFAVQVGTITREQWQPETGTYERVPVTDVGVSFNTYFHELNGFGQRVERQGSLIQAASAIYQCMTEHQISSTLADMPYPISVRNIAVVDHLTERRFTLTNASLTLNYSGDGECPTPQYEPNTFGSIGVAENQDDLIWYYDSAQHLHEFAFQTHAKFKKERYENAASPWQIQVFFQSEDGNHSAGASMLLRDYLTQTGQSLVLGDDANVDLPLLVQPKLFSSTWHTRFAADGWVDFSTLPGASTTVRLYVNIFDNQGNYLARSLALHAEGIGVNLQPGSPPQGEPLANMTYRGVAPDSVTFRAGERGSVTTTQTLDVNKSVQAPFVDLNQFVWRWRSELGYFNGTTWQSTPADLPIGTDPLFDQSAARLVLQDGVKRLVVSATLPAVGLPGGFWPEDRDLINLYFEVIYRGPNGAGTLVAEGGGDHTNRVRFNRVLPSTSAVQSPQWLNSGLRESEQENPLELLQDNPSAELQQAFANAFAPEPLVLQAQDVGAAVNQTWVLGQAGLTALDLRQTPATLADPAVYGWVTLPFDPSADSGRHRVFVVPYPDHKDGSPLPWFYANRRAVTLQKNATTWRRDNNLFYRYVPGSVSHLGEFQICVFVPQSHIKRSDLDATLEPGWRENMRLTGFFEAEGEKSWGQSQSHNRIVSINYPNPNDPEQRIVTVAFSDLIGRAQETRTMATHVPFKWLDRVAVSGAQRYDALGRVQSTAKAYDVLSTQGPSSAPYGVLTPPNALIAAPSPSGSFHNAENYWRAAASAGDKPELEHIVGRDANAFNEVIYDRDPAKQRVLAEVPFGRHARNPDDPLRYSRYHYFILPVFNSAFGDTPPPEARLVFQNLSVHQQFSYAVTEDGRRLPIVEGRVAIDPNGLMAVTLSDGHGNALVEIGNPSIELLEDWGFDVRIGQAQIDPSLGTMVFHTNETIHLPADYHQRVAANPLSSGSDVDGNKWHADFNLANFTEVNEEGLVVGAWPPKALQLRRGQNGSAWQLSPAQGHAGLRVTHRYDALGRLIETVEPDSGLTEYVVDRQGRTRLVRHAGDIEHNQWLETVYDDMSRVVQTRVVSFPGITANQRETLQNLFVPENPSQAVPADQGGLPEEGTSSAVYRVRVVQASVVTYRYGEYDLFNERFPWSTSYREGAYWPTIDALEAAYPWDHQGLLFAEPLEGLVEIMADQSAERFYYDWRGRMICHVQLIRGVLEPQVTWLRYDQRDLVVARYNQTHHLGTGYAYDPFGRVVQSYDLAPLSERMRLNVAYRHQDAAADHLGDTVVAVLGPLVDEQSNVALEEQSRQLGSWDYTITGHVREVVYGGDGSAAITNRYTYDMRNWLMSQQVQIDGVDTYSVDLDYFGLGGLMDGDGAAQTLKMFDGSIAALSENYHLEGGEHGLVTQHEYGYDGNYQLTRSVQRRDAVLTHRYGYDRNGNRIREHRIDTFNPLRPERFNVYLNHELTPGTNQLATVRKDEGYANNTPRYRRLDFRYDEMGNVVGIQRFKDGDGALEVDQSFTYGDARYRHQPTRLAQTSYGNEAESGYAAETRDYRYNQDGTRIYRSVQKGGDRPEIKYFVPNGLENAAELDAWGRARRAYVFNGGERIAYKSKANTGLYIKDHLGSTKLVIALNRDMPTDESEVTPPQAPAPPAVVPETVVSLAFDGNLNAVGQVTESSFIGDANYMSRFDNRALWFDRNESLQINDPAVAQLTEQFTIMLWAYDNDEDDGEWDHGTMVTVGGGASIRYNPIHFYFDGNKLPVLRLGGGADGWQFFSQFGRMPVKTWVHLAVTYDGQFVRCYQNGELLGEPQAVDLPALFPAEDLHLGNWPGHEDYAWEGGLDEVVIAARAKEEGAIRDHFLRTSPGAPSQTEATQAGNLPADQATRDRVRALLILTRADADAFGITLNESYGALAGGKTEPHQFTGQEVEKGLGLIYMNGRWYLPEVGRFLQADPLRQYWNVYIYVGNNPVNRVDPTGLEDETIEVTNIELIEWSFVNIGTDDVFYFTGGAVNAFGSNLMMGAGRSEEDHFSFEVGQAFGDGLSMVAGNQMMFSGATMIVAGGAMIAAGVVGAPLLVGGALVAGGAGLVVWGGLSAGSGFHHGMTDTPEWSTHSFSKGKGQKRKQVSADPEARPQRRGNHAPSKIKDTKLSGPNNVRSQLRDAYEEIRLGRGTPNLDKNGKQKIFEGRDATNRQWAGALEFKVPGLDGARILYHKGKNMLGYTSRHDYDRVVKFPGPFYQENGPPVKSTH